MPGFLRFLFGGYTGSRCRHFRPSRNNRRNKNRERMIKESRRKNRGK